MNTEIINNSSVIIILLLLYVLCIMYYTLVHREMLIHAEDNTNMHNNEYITTTHDTNGLIENHTVWLIITMMFNTLSISFCFCSLIFIMYFRNHPIIKIAQPGFLCLMIVGAIFVALSGFYFPLVETCERWRNQAFLELMCCWGICSLVTGHILVYMGLFGKLWRIKKVTRIRRGQPPVKEWHTRWPLFVVRILSTIVLITWMFVAHPSWMILDNKNDGRPVGRCYYENQFIWPIIILILFCAILGLFMAYETQNVPDELSDGKYIYQIYCLHMGSYIVFGSLWIIGKSIGIPICILVGEILFCVFLSITSIAPLIVPKMYCIWYEHKHGHVPDGFEMSFGGGQVHVGEITPTAGTTTTGAIHTATA